VARRPSSLLACGQRLTERTSTSLTRTSCQIQWSIIAHPWRSMMKLCACCLTVESRTLPVEYRDSQLLSLACIALSDHIHIITSRSCPTNAIVLCFVTSDISSAHFAVSVFLVWSQISRRRPAENQRGPRGRPLSGPLHVPPLFPPLSSPPFLFPLPPNPLPSPSFSFPLLPSLRSRPLKSR